MRSKCKTLRWLEWSIKFFSFCITDHHDVNKVLSNLEITLFEENGEEEGEEQQEQKLIQQEEQEQEKEELLKEKSRRPDSIKK